MGYHTYINHVQLFDNLYPEWIDFVKSQGIVVDENYRYDGEITDVMGAIDVIEKIILKEDKKFKEIYKYSLFDLNEIREKYLEDKKYYPNDEYNSSLTDRLLSFRVNGIIFMSCTFIDACKDSIEKDRCFATPGHFHSYRLKEGKTIHVSAM